MIGRVKRKKAYKMMQNIPVINPIPIIPNEEKIKAKIKTAKNRNSIKRGCARRLEPV
jgi:hypothetical protein